MPTRYQPPARSEPLAPHEAVYAAEHRKRPGSRNASLEQLCTLARDQRPTHPSPDGANLSDAELAAIYEYTTDADFIAEFNALMRDDLRAAMEAHGGFIGTLGSALAKLPPYPGQVWRGSGILSPPEMETLMQEGAIFRPGYFWSTAHDRRGLEEYSDEIVFDIRSKIGKNISQMSAKGRDYEVLFPPDAAFRVEKVNARDAGKWAIQLTDLGRPDEEG